MLERYVNFIKIKNLWIIKIRIFVTIVEQKRQNYLLGIFLIGGFILRLISVILHSYSSDELSAITRLKYDSLSDLIEFGVKTGDMHPAGVQFFMKIWSSLFGVSEVVMRLPFILLGTLSIYLIYKIGSRFSAQVGLFSAGLWAFLMFPIIQSELARPYSPGVFFVLLSAIFILKFIFDSATKKQYWYYATFLGLSISAAMYTHYFAFLLVAFMALTGLIFIKKHVLIPYVFAGLLSIILFIPHLSITIYQTSIEGGIQWLSPPGKYWLLQFLFHAFNNSWLLILIFMGTSFMALYYLFSNKGAKFSKNTVIFFLWFFGIYIIGVFLSYNFTPVLKFPVMVFAFPFFIILFSKFISHTFKHLHKFFPVALLALTLFSTTFEKSLFHNIHYEVFKELADHIRNWEKQIGLNNATIIMNISSPEYLNFYAKQSGKVIKLDLSVIDYGDANVIDSLLYNSMNDYLIIGFSGRHTPVQFFNQALKHYPYIVDGHQYNNSCIYLLSKNANDSKKQFEIEQSISFASSTAGWNFEKSKLVEKYMADSTNVYRPEYILPTNYQLQQNNQFIRVVLSANSNESHQVSIVAIPETATGEPVTDNYGNPIWLGFEAEKDLMNHKIASFAFSLPPLMPKHGRVKIYIWNRNKGSFQINNVEIQIVNNVWNN